MSREQEVLSFITAHPGSTEPEVARGVWGPGGYQQLANAVVRRLGDRGLVERRREGGVYRCYVTGQRPPAPPPSQGALLIHEGAPLSEDQIKQVLCRRLGQDGWTCEVKMGQERGIDIDAHRSGARWIIEAKGPGSLQPMRVNYFLAILGETLQRMDDANARYSIALPDIPQYRRLWERLPKLAKERTLITCIFVGPRGEIQEYR
ncbi:MAG: hypothetical protein K1X67_10370 [Fimbriimonadaceae bacterium]|nr:hypothetical protein [Fimbriimonadaceae bacterium]